MKISQKYYGDYFGKIEMNANSSIDVIYKSCTQSYKRKIEYNDLEIEKALMKSGEDGWFKYSIFLFIIGMLGDLGSGFLGFSENHFIQLINIIIFFIALVCFLFQFRKSTYRYYRNKYSGKLEFGVRIPDGNDFCKFIDTKIEDAVNKK